MITGNILFMWAAFYDDSSLPSGIKDALHVWSRVVA